MSAMERRAIAQQQVQQVAEKKARQQQLLHEDWQYARSQADIARNMASQANQVSVQDWMLLLSPSYMRRLPALCMGSFVALCMQMLAAAISSDNWQVNLHSVPRVLLGPGLVPRCA